MNFPLFCFVLAGARGGDAGVNFPFVRGELVDELGQRARTAPSAGVDVGNLLEYFDKMARVCGIMHHNCPISCREECVYGQGDFGIPSGKQQACLCVFVYRQGSNVRRTSGEHKRGYDGGRRGR